MFFGKRERVSSFCGCYWFSLDELLNLEYEFVNIFIIEGIAFMVLFIVMMLVPATKTWGLEELESKKLIK